jgi:hypothetical protein
MLASDGRNVYILILNLLHPIDLTTQSALKSVTTQEMSYSVMKALWMFSYLLKNKDKLYVYIYMCVCVCVYIYCAKEMG